MKTARETEEKEKQEPQRPAPQMLISIDIDGLQGPETEKYIFKKMRKRKTKASASNVNFYRHRWITRERNQNIRKFNEKYIFVIFLHLS